MFKPKTETHRRFRDRETSRDGRIGTASAAEASKTYQSHVTVSSMATCATVSGVLFEVEQIRYVKCCTSVKHQARDVERHRHPSHL